MSMKSRSAKCLLLLITFCFLDVIKCDIKEDVRNRVKELEERSRRLYGDARERSVKQWELNVADSSLYPNGDKQKLADTSQRWMDYYRCTARAVESVTSAGRLPSFNVVVYQGAAARVPCGLCVAPGESELVKWSYAQSLHNLTFQPMGVKSTMISGVNLTIYNVQFSDAGVYRCSVGRSVSGLAVLQVLDDEEYHVINEDNHRSSDASIQTASGLTLTVFTSWSPWSDCSRCDYVGFRLRYGMCYVRMNNKFRFTTGSKETVFQEFPAGIGCGSRLLPSTYSTHPTIADRKNVIMTASCKNSCMQVFEVRSKTGELIERADNSAGVFSCNQSPPPQPTPPVRDVIFVESGGSLVIKCPGTTLRDIPITWRKGTQYMDSEAMALQTTDRVQLNARGQIVIKCVQLDDTNVYSCWQSNALAGVVKVQVDAPAGRPATLAWLAGAAVALRFAFKLMRDKQQRLRSI